MSQIVVPSYLSQKICDQMQPSLKRLQKRPKKMLRRRPKRQAELLNNKCVFYIGQSPLFLYLFINCNLKYLYLFFKVQTTEVLATDVEKEFFGYLPLCQSGTKTNRKWTDIMSMDKTLEGKTVWARARLQESRCKGSLYSRAEEMQILYSRIRQLLTS